MTMVMLNLSAWIERRAANIGPYADHIVHSVQAYEREIAQLREALYRADEGLNYLHMYDEAHYSKPAQRCAECDCDDPPKGCNWIKSDAADEDRRPNYRDYMPSDAEWMEEEERMAARESKEQ